MLHKINLIDVDIYSRCPRKYFYSQPAAVEPLLPLPGLLKHIMGKVYLEQVKLGLRSAWKTTTSEIDKYSFSSVDINLEGEVDKAYKQSIRLIEEVKNRWYNSHYLRESYDGFADLPIRHMYGQYEVEDIVDLVLFDEDRLVVCKIGNVDTNPVSMYNDIRFRSQALLLSKELGKPITGLRHISWTNHITITDSTIRNSNKFCEDTEQAITHMLQGIHDKVFYPSVNTQCLSCPHRSKCSF